MRRPTTRVIIALVLSTFALVWARHDPGWLAGSAQAALVGLALGIASHVDKPDGPPCNMPFPTLLRDEPTTTWCSLRDGHRSPWHRADNGARFREGTR